MPQNMLSTADVAAYLQITIERVLAYIRDQELPASWIGRKWRIAMPDVLALVAANKKGR